MAEGRRVSSTHPSATGTSAAAIRKRAGLLDPTPDQAGAFWRENEPHMLPIDEARVCQAWFWTLDWLLGELAAPRARARTRFCGPVNAVSSCMRTDGRHTHDGRCVHEALHDAEEFCEFLELRIASDRRG
jgi:hypothetical protein